MPKLSPLPGTPPQNSSRRRVDGVKRPKKSAKPLAPSRPRPSLKRFAEGLTPGARRSRALFPHDARASYATSSQALCRVCNVRIASGLARVALFLQCHLGYKDPSLTHYVHLGCLRLHPEAHKLSGDEVFDAKILVDADRAILARELAAAAAPAAHAAPAAPAAHALLRPQRHALPTRSN